VQKGARIGVDGVEGVMILIGNKHKLVRNPGDANQHDWTFFVRTSRPELVEEVRIDLVSCTRCFHSRGLVYICISAHDVDLLTITRSWCCCKTPYL
jgi:hypothetical protein